MDHRGLRAKPALKWRVTERKLWHKTREAAGLAIMLGRNNLWRDRRISIDINMPTSEAARHIRALLDIDRAAVPYSHWHAERRKTVRAEKATTFWARRIQRLGVILVRAGTLKAIPTTKQASPDDVEKAHISGLCVHHELTPMIVINKSEEGYRPIFTMLHELTHLCLGASSIDLNIEWHAIDESADPLETFCDAVALEVLLPSEHPQVRALRQRGDRATPKEIRDTAQELCVSEAVVLRRCVQTRANRQALYSALAIQRIPQARGGGGVSGTQSEEEKRHRRVQRAKRFWGEFYCGLLKEAWQTDLIDDAETIEALAVDGWASAPHRLQREDLAGT